MSNQVADVELHCADCGHKFIFSAENQVYFRDKGYAPPKRCKPCRAVKKQARADGQNTGGER
jgi:hypothetical protein